MTTALGEMAAAPPSMAEGRYVYCVGPAVERLDLGTIGIAGATVYGVPHRDLCALVHDCPAQAYLSESGELVAAWALAHHRVVEAAWQHWGTVLPVAFNTVIKGGPGSPQENLVAWLEGDHQSLQAKLQGLEGKAEYGVQVFWDPRVIASNLAGLDAELRELEAEIRASARGRAYMYRQRLARLLARHLEAKGAEEFQELYARLSPWAEAVRVGKTNKGEEGRQMLINLSCLVATTRYPGFEAELRPIGDREGFSLRLAGPLPPYSFC